MEDIAHHEYSVVAMITSMSAGTVQMYIGMPLQATFTRSSKE